LRRKNPMAVEVLMPKLDMTMEEATIIRWLKQEGEWVEKGEPILEIMTEKIVMEVEAPASGILAGIRVGPDDVVPVGQVIAYILAPGEKLEDVAKVPPKVPPLKAPAQQEIKPIEKVTPQFEKVRATPAARRLAREHGIDLTKVTPSGPHGEVVEEDVIAYMKSLSEAVSIPSRGPRIAEKIPLQGWRKITAQRMQQSNEIPQIALTVEVDMSEAARKRGPCSFTAVIVQAVAQTLRKYPVVNSSLQGDEIIIYKDINIGVAVDTEQGLIVPVVKNADEKSLSEIDKEIKELARKAREGRLALEEVSGGTFTVSNLGMFGIDNFQALINPPQGAILAVGEIQDRPMAIGGHIEIRPTMKMTISADHRILDGATVARFLADVKVALEQPAPKLEEIKETPRVAIVGGGFGGYSAALRAAELGAYVTLIEKDKLGGTCLNVGCIPTKILLETANRVLSLSELEEHGLKVNDWSLDFKVVQERKGRIVGKLVNSLEQRLKRAGVQVVKGFARFVSTNRLVVEKGSGETIEVEANKVIVATGSEASLIAGLPKALTSTEALELVEIPNSLLIVGGGVIGVEFACIFSTFGSKVTIVEALPRILPTEDKDISEALFKALQRRGIEILTGATVEGTDGEEVIISTPKGQKRLQAEKILVAVGRKPYTEGLGLDKIGIHTSKGAIIVNEFMETNVPGVYAVGDVTGKYFLAHVAAAEGEAAAENALGKKRFMNYAAVPRCIFSMPEIAAVGLTEEEARSQGYKVSVGVYPWAGVEKALIEGHTEGLVKVVAAEGELLGLHIIGYEASNLIMEGVLAVALSMPLERLASLMHPHPTLAEAVQRAVYKALRESS
jgi:dihydrolipoamide dehydrogenase